MNRQHNMEIAIGILLGSLMGLTIVIARSFQVSAWLPLVMLGVLGGGVLMVMRWHQNREHARAERMKQARQALTAIAEATANGDFHAAMPPELAADDLHECAAALDRTRQTMQQLLTEIGRVMAAVQAGDLSQRGQSELFSGAWQQLLATINTALERFAVPFQLTTTCLDQIAKGEMPNRIIGEYQGAFQTMITKVNTLIDAMNEVTWLSIMIASGSLDVTAKERSEQDRLMKALNAMIQQLRGVSVETEAIIRGVQHGHLTVRGNTAALSGKWRDLICGVNTIVEAFVAPITLTATALERIAKGDIPEKLTEEDRGDFNTITQSVNTLIDAMTNISQLAKDMADGNLTIEVHERSAQDTLMRALNTMVLRLQRVVAAVKGASQSVALNSQEVSARAEDMSHGATQQASAMEEVSSSMEQMSANIHQNSENARQTEKIALQSLEYTEEGGKVVAETVIEIQQIAEKIKIIEDIALQTRMLSLNATIEAGRAEEYGKAFSVVAAEVRHLSDTTKQAAEDINKLAVFGLDVSARAGEMLRTLVPSIRKTTELVQEISAASNEQSTGTEQINHAMQQLDQVAQHNALMSEELASTAEQLTSQAKHLQQTIDFFKIPDGLVEHVSGPALEAAAHPAPAGARPRSGAIQGAIVTDEAFERYV